MTDSDIENTANRDPLLHLLGAMGQGSSDYITGLEAAGQQQFVNSSRFPTDRRGDFEALGFTFGEPDPDDPFFCDATLPDGWWREASDHDMWSYIVDAQGIRRIAVFYKAAPYDRRAFARIEELEDTRPSDGG